MPNEGFVQAAIEAHFRAKGFEFLPGGDADLVCRDPSSGEHWVVEAKGLTTSIGLDFRTGLGQLIQRMAVQGHRYAVAVPALPSFISQCRRVPEWVRVALGVHWLVVAADHSVTTYAPTDQPTSADYP